ncbi:MAG: hypothetical protein ACLQHF_09010 [Terracidiphilus sp.]
MKRPFKIVRGFAIVLASVFLFLLWDTMGYWPIPATRGRLDARIDLAHGRYEILGYGLPPLGMDRYISLLRQRYGVDYRVVAGCTVSKETLDYVEAYDSVSGSAINRKFGHDIFKEVASESFNIPKTTPMKDNVNQPAR